MPLPPPPAQFNSRTPTLTISPAVIEYCIPTANSQPLYIAAGPDRALWFTENNGNKIGRITTSGVVTEYVVPTVLSQSFDITAGPDGAPWFTESGGDKIGRITTSGTITEFTLPTFGLFRLPYGITAGPAGALWFTENAAEQIGRITTAGAISEFPVGGSSSPHSITTGPDGATESGSNKIGRMALWFQTLAQDP